MGAKDYIFITNICNLILKHGTSMAIQIIKSWDKDDPTIEDIRTLQNYVIQKPERFFKDKCDVTEDTV